MAQSSSKIFFHLGLPKTASTFLQLKIFPRLPGIEYYKKHDFRKYKTLSAETGKSYFFTCEKDDELADEFNNIKTRFPDNSYVILVFRPHYSWLVSKYKNYVRKFGHLSFDDFFSVDKPSHFEMSPDYYSQIADLCKNKFNNRVLLLNFEELKQSPDKFLRKIYDFIGLEDEEVQYSNRVVKKAFSNRQVKILRSFNKIHPYKRIHTKFKAINFVHYKYFHFMVHIVAFFARFIPVKTSDLEEELKKDRAEIENYFKADWDNMLKKFS
ncbi:MAG: sulfotransferase [Prolixibacteraceae bacterium]|nr:sulfotransferase [Prolixibacteraceae bacterium]